MKKFFKIVMILSLVILSGEYNMLKSESLFSAVSGTVLKNAQPIKGAKVIQSYKWFSVDNLEKITFTNKKGEFEFSEIEVKKKWIPSKGDIFISQKIVIEHDGQLYTAWEHTKTNYLKNSELPGQDIKIIIDLKNKNHSYKIPSYEGSLSLIDGLSKIEHPYVKLLEETMIKLKGQKKKLEVAILSYIKKEDVKSYISEQTYLSGIQEISVVETLGISEFKLDNLALYDGPNGNGQSPYKKPLYVGGTISAKLTLLFENTQSQSFNLYWPKVLIKLKDLESDYILEGELSALSIDTRDFFKEKVRKKIDRELVKKALLRRVQKSPTDSILYALHSKLKISDQVYNKKKLSSSQKADFNILDIEFNKFDIINVNVKNRFLSVSVGGTLQVEGRVEKVFFSSSFELQIKSLSRKEYEIFEEEDHRLFFDINTFRINISLKKVSYLPNEKINLLFKATNLLEKENIFLIWHTPFEGFSNDFLEIIDLETGAEIQYMGKMCSRQPPLKSNGSYLEFAPKKSKSKSINIREAYELPEGRYSLKFKSLGGSLFFSEDLIEFSVIKSFSLEDENN